MLNVLVYQVLGQQCITLKMELMKYEHENTDINKYLIFTRQNGRTYSVGFIKAAYSWIENQIPVTSIGMVMNMPYLKGLLVQALTLFLVRANLENQ